MTLLSLQGSWTQISCFGQMLVSHCCKNHALKKISKISEQRTSQAKYVKNKRVITTDKKKIIFSKKEAKKKTIKNINDKINKISSIFSLHSELCISL